MPTLEDQVRPLLDHPVDRPSVDSLRSVVRVRRQRRRLARGSAVLVVILAALAVVTVSRRDYPETVSAGPATTAHSAETPSSSPPTTEQLSHTFQDDGLLSFRYPASWAAEHFDEFSTQTFLITFVSNQVLHDPCTTTVLPNSNTEIACDNPLKSLTPDGVLITWSSIGMIGLTLDRTPGTPTIIGGRPAHLSSDIANAGCASLGADQSITAWISRGAEVPGDNLLTMTACFRGPDLASIQAEVEAMLASVTFPTK